MDIVQHDHMIQTLPTDGADHSLGVRILPGRSRCGRNFVDPHALDAIGEMVAVDAVAIAKQKSRRPFVGKRVNDLLGSPLGIGIRRNVEVNDLPPIVPKHDENIEYPKRGRRHGKEITRGNVRHVITEECVRQVCEGG